MHKCVLLPRDKRGKIINKIIINIYTNSITSQNHWTDNINVQFGYENYNWLIINSRVYLSYFKFWTYAHFFVCTLDEFSWNFALFRGVILRLFLRTSLTSAAQLCMYSLNFVKIKLSKNKTWGWIFPSTNLI